jgi:hypothetical protein
MNRSREFEERVHLARSNVHMIAVALGKVVAAGADAENVCVLLADTRDAVARELTAAIIERSGDLNLDAEERRALGKNMIPTGLAVLDARVAEVLFSESYPVVAGTVGQRCRPGAVRVVVVAAGGATLLHLPIKPLRSIGGA